MSTIDWIATYVFLGYPPSSQLEAEIFAKAKEVGASWKRGNPKDPNDYPFLSKITYYPQSFLQEYFQDRIGNP